MPVLPTGHTVKFAGWPVGNTGIGFANTIANTGVVGIDFLAAGAAGTSSNYGDGQLPSYGIVGKVSIGAVCRHARTFNLLLLAVALVIGWGMWTTRKKICDL